MNSAWTSTLLGGFNSQLQTNELQLDETNKSGCKSGHSVNYSFYRTSKHLLIDVSQVNTDAVPIQLLKRSGIQGGKVKGLDEDSVRVQSG